MNVKKMASVCRTWWGPRFYFIISGFLWKLSSKGKPWFHFCNESTLLHKKHKCDSYFWPNSPRKDEKTRLFILRLKIIRYFTLLCFSLKYTFKVLRGWFIDYFCCGEFPSVHFINRWAKLKLQLLSYIFRQCLVCFWKLRFFSSSTVNFHSWVRWSQIQMWVYVIWTNYLTSPFSSESWDY